LVAAGLLLLTGDVWAAATRRLYPFTVHRQARQSLIIQWRRPQLVVFVWGADAGLGVATYRVTSGLWLFLIAAVAGVASAAMLLVSAAAFAVGLLATSLIARDEIGLAMARRRRYPQIAYVFLASAWLLVVTIGSLR
jgi:hypothetical protein